PSDIDPQLRELDELVLRAVAPDPANRYQTAAELRDALQVALAAKSPTLTNDRLGAFMSELFAEEMNEEKEALRQARQIDMSPYADELADGRTEPVSFAIGHELSDAASRLPLPAERTESTGKPIVLDETPASLRTPPKRSRLPFLAAALTGALAAFLIFWRT